MCLRVRWMFTNEVSSRFEDAVAEALLDVLMGSPGS